MISYRGSTGNPFGLNASPPSFAILIPFFTYGRETPSQTGWSFLFEDITLTKKVFHISAILPRLLTFPPESILKDPSRSLPTVSKKI